MTEINYPKCKEIKHLLLTGETHIFDCERLMLTGDFGILRYFLKKSVKVNNLILPDETITLGFYWQNQPYTLYRWFDAQGNPLADYFNIAADIHLSPDRFEWRDLIVDILISRQGRATVLDEADLPSDIDTETARYIHEATNHILQNYPDILNKTVRFTKQLF